MLIDLHVHTRSTRGCELDPKQVIQKAAQLGLDGICFTDLNTLDACEEVLELAKNAPVACFVGVELAADHGHYLAYFPDPKAVPDPVQLFGENKSKAWATREVLERVVALGGVAVAAHPYDRDVDRPSGDYIFTLKDKLVAIEGLNGRRKPGVNDLAVEAAEHMGLPCIGASGAQTDITEVGRAATFFKGKVSSHAELVAALKAGDFFAVGVGRPPALSELARAPKHSGERGGERDRGGRGGGERGDRGDRGDRRGGRGGRGGGRGGRPFRR
jgi:predicted metal-dependent phosphoesterase TrpH